MNPNQANVRHLNGRKATVSLQKLAPRSSKEKQKDNFGAVDTEIHVYSESPNHTPDDACSNESRQEIVPASPQPNLPLKSARSNKGVPPFRYGIRDSSV